MQLFFFIMKENRKSSFIFAKKAVRNSCQCVFYMFVSNRDETRRIHAALITNKNKRENPQRASEIHIFGVV